MPHVLSNPSTLVSNSPIFEELWSITFESESAEVFTCCARLRIASAVNFRPSTSCLISLYLESVIKRGPAEGGSLGTGGIGVAGRGASSTGMAPGASSGSSVTSSPKVGDTGGWASATREKPHTEHICASAGLSVLQFGQTMFCGGATSSISSTPSIFSSLASFQRWPYLLINLHAKVKTLFALWE